MKLIDFIPYYGLFWRIMKIAENNPKGRLIGVYVVWHTLWILGAFKLLVDVSFRLIYGTWH